MVPLFSMTSQYIIGMINVFPTEWNKPYGKKRWTHWITFYILFVILLSIFEFWWNANTCILGLTKNRLGIPDLGIDEKYQHLLQNYGRDIEMVSRIYMKQKLDPPIGRDLPPVAGRILWARQLSSRIQSPMDLFQQVIFNFCLSRMKLGWA